MPYRAWGIATDQRPTRGAYARAYGPFSMSGVKVRSAPVKDAEMINAWHT